MEMDIYSVNPSSLKINKSSAFASKLKAAIVAKLNHNFSLTKYSNDVLAEYIVVLICNGKNQHQARYDLEAFLGEDSKEFVSWLWNLLLESVDRLRKPKRASYLEDEIVNGGDAVGNNKHRPRTLTGIHSHAKGDASDVLSEDEKEYCRSMLAPQPVSSNDRPKGSQHYSLESYRSSLNEIDDMEGSTKLFKHVCSKKSEPTKGALNYAPSRESESSEDTSSDSERSTSYENDDKIVIRNNSADLPRPALRLPKDERPSNISKLITGDNQRHGPSSKIDVAENRSSSRPIDSVSHPNVKPRGSVWDRLGRPSINERIVQGCRPTGEVPARDNKPVSVISNTSFADEGRRRGHDLNRMRVPHHAHTMNMKRQFDAISEEEGKYRHLQYTEPPLKQLQISPSSKATRSVVLNNISSGTRRTGPLRADRALGSSVSAFIPDVNVGPQRKSCGEATDTGKTALKPVQSRLLDMNVRFHQIEMEMSKIKEKSPESNEETSKILPSSGALMYAPPRESETSEATSESERRTSYKNDDKIVRSNSADLPRKPLRLPKDERPNISKLITGEKRSSSRPRGSVEPYAKPRGSVQDKLGRPPVNARIVRGKSIEAHGDHLVKRTVGPLDEPYKLNRMMHFVPGCRLTGEVPPCDNRPVTVISDTKFADENSAREHDRNRMWIPQNPHTIKEPPVKQIERSPSFKSSTHADVLTNILSRTRQIKPLRAGQALSVDAFILDVHDGSERKSCGEATDAGKTDLSSPQYVRSMPGRRSKIKEKTPESNEDTFLSSYGESHQFGGDHGSRTLFVTNVHFAATKQALSQHFVKCGVIIKVAILNDAATHKPKGAAYITFAEKESADKALALSGTSFWSRPLKVVRKADMHLSVIPPQMTGKLCWPQPYSARPYVGSLQWRGDQPVSDGTTEQNDTVREEGRREEEMKEEYIMKFLRNREGLDKGTTGGVIPVEDGFVFFADGKTSVEDYILYNETEKFARLTDNISMIHGGMHENCMDVVTTLKSLPPRCIKHYAEKARKMYRKMKDKLSHTYMFGNDSTEGVCVYYADGEKVYRAESSYHVIGGEDEEEDYVQEKLKELLPSGRKPSKEEAMHIAEITLVHCCLNLRCTGGLLTVQYVPNEGTEMYERIDSTDLGLYIKQYESFEDSNKKSLLLLVPTEVGMDNVTLQGILGHQYFGVQKEEDGSLEKIFFLDVFYNPGADYQLFRATFKSVDERNRLYEDDRIDCHSLELKYKDKDLSNFKKVRDIVYGIIGIAKCEYETLFNYYISTL